MRTALLFVYIRQQTTMRPCLQFFLILHTVSLQCVHMIQCIRQFLQQPQIAKNQKLF